MERGGGFLGLSRAEGEWIYVDGPCCIKVTAAGASKARLACKAPKSTTIVRGELLPPAKRRELGMSDGYVGR